MINLQNKLTNTLKVVLKAEDVPWNTAIKKKNYNDSAHVWAQKYYKSFYKLLVSNDHNSLPASIVLIK